MGTRPSGIIDAYVGVTATSPSRGGGALGASCTATIDDIYDRLLLRGRVAA